MRAIIARSVVTVLLTVAAWWSLKGSPQPVVKGGGPAPALRVDVADRNPWTHLRLATAGDDFRFAVVTDRTGGRRPGVFARAVEKLNLLQPEFVMSVGDLIEGYTEDPGRWAMEWSEFEELVTRLQMPFFFCPGNHDISNLPMSREWQRKFGRSYYSFVYRNCLFLVLNTEDPPEKGKPYQFSVRQRQWAVETLRRHGDVRWTFVFLHKPTWTYTGADHAALGWSTIEDALQDRPYTVFAGHKHVYAKFLRRGREYYMLATTGGASPLTGVAEGRFDHFVWVTMRGDRPQIANVLLQGVVDSDIRRLPDPTDRATPSR